MFWAEAGVTAPIIPLISSPACISRPSWFDRLNNVAYLLHARLLSHRNSRFQVIHARNNGTTGLCNRLFGNGSVNTILCRCNDVISQQCSAITWLVFSVWSALRNSRTVFSTLSVPRLYTSPLAAKKIPKEFLLEFWGSTVIEQEMARRLHSDFKC
jgi:hypothetical protein